MDNIKKIENDIAILIVNYNGYFFTINCIESILNSNFPINNIYVIDNFSSDNSFRKINDAAIFSLL